MANTLAQKLRIKEDYVLRTRNAPASFAKDLGALPEGVHLSTGANRFDQLHWFVTDRAQLEADLPEVLPLINGDVLCWVYYPKGSSKAQTDLTRDQGWDALFGNGDMQRLSLISFNDTWSAFAFRRYKEIGADGAPKQKLHPVLAYIDPVSKTVRVPDDLATAFQSDKEAAEHFDKLAYSHKKEYVEWIVSAKREETRAQRVAGTVERLKDGWKNPRNQ